MAVLSADPESGLWRIAAAAAPTSTYQNELWLHQVLTLAAGKARQVRLRLLVFPGRRSAYDPSHRPTEWKLPPI